jgi:hypothetical protein
MNLSKRLEEARQAFLKKKKRQSLPPDPRSKSNNACHGEAGYYHLNRKGVR